MFLKERQNFKTVYTCCCFCLRRKLRYFKIKQNSHYVIHIYFTLKSFTTSCKVTLMKGLPSFGLVKPTIPTNRKWRVACSAGVGIFAVQYLAPYLQTRCVTLGATCPYIWPPVPQSTEFSIGPLCDYLFLRSMLILSFRLRTGNSCGP